MVSKEQQIQDLLKARIRRLLTVAELAIPEGRFHPFRKIVLDEFGRSGFGKDLERVFRGKTHSGE